MKRVIKGIGKTRVWILFILVFMTAIFVLTYVLKLCIQGEYAVWLQLTGAAFIVLTGLYTVYLEEYVRTEKKTIEKKKLEDKQ